MKTDFIHTLTEIVEANLSNENFGPEDLANKIGMSHSSLHRKLKELSNQTISQFIREIRLKKAKEILLSEDITVSEVAYNVGFGSATYFNKCFHEYFGIAPGEFRKKEMESEPEEETGPSKPKKKIKNILLFVIAPVLILALVSLLLNERFSILKKENKGENSIAVKPFKYLSKNSEKDHLSDAMMIEIVNQLSLIKDLIVMSSTSIDPSTHETDKEIGKRLGVAFLLDGNLQIEGNEMILSLRLIKTNNESIVWTKPYRKNLKDILDTQSEIAKTVANQLNAVITPEEKQRIEKVPTISLKAYDFYQKGRYEYQKYWFDNENREALNRAEKHYNTALNYDSAFALAYTGLAQIYRDKNYYKEYFTKNFLDTVLLLANFALSFDDQLAEAHNLIGIYYYETGNFKQAIEEYDRALKFNPNLWEAYFNKGKLYLYKGEETEKQIYNLHQALLIHRGPSLPELFQHIARAYLNAGFFEQAEYYFHEALSLDRDSALFLNRLAGIETGKRNYNEAIQLGMKAFQFDSTYTDILNLLGFNYAIVNKHTESLKYYKKMYEKLQKQKALNINNMHRIGYAYFKNEFKNEANFFFNKQIKFCEETIELKRPYSIAYWAYYDLAGVYAFLEEKEKAYENLRLFCQKQIISLVGVRLINDDPLFESIRDEPEFQQIVSDVEAKCLAEHERVKKWLEEQELL